ncbi:SDR family oxidoreductase [uncultured Maricaulis sp.]|uniref:SDR family NAD(P)-dependent oxidoreductase n=1 Tax=uncultured Maricaulis sp. TaxID=174710 RepID=UPI0030D894C5|tara:strand:- start:22130 stop:22879 length:750 start_codon:yes stop_codon:yes gene_type:complete
MAKGQRAVCITGVAGGIGAALGAAYRKAGWRVIGSGRQAPDPGICDVFVEADLDRLAENDQALEEFAAEVRAGLDGAALAALINNAAVQILAPADKLTAQDWRRTLNVNLTAPFRLSQVFLPELEDAGGAILNIGSVHAQATKPGFTAYATSKAALHGLTRALAVDMGKRVRVVCLAPAAISTPMLMAGFEGREEAFKSLQACHPSERIGVPEEVADAALFLTSPQASFVTGSTFWLDGGVLARLHDPV